MNYIVFITNMSNCLIVTTTSSDYLTLIPKEIYLNYILDYNLTLSNLIKFTQISKTLRTFFLNPLFWTYIIDSQKILTNFIKHMMKSKNPISYPIASIKNMYKNDPNIYCDICLNNTGSIEKCHCKTYIVTNLMLISLSKFYHKFCNYECAFINCDKNITIFTNSKHFKIIYLESIINPIVVKEIFRYNQIDTIISSENLILDSFNNTFNFSIKLLMAPSTQSCTDSFNIERIIYKNYNSIQPDKSIQLQRNIGNLYIPQNIVSLTITNRIFISSENLEPFSRLTNLNYLFIIIKPKWNYNWIFSMKTEQLKVKIWGGGSCYLLNIFVINSNKFTIFTTLECTRTFLNFSLNATQTTNCIIQLDKIIRAKLFLPKCKILSLPCFYSSMDLNAPILESFLFKRFMVEKNECIYLNYVEINAEALKCVDLEQYDNISVCITTRKTSVTIRNMNTNNNLDFDDKNVRYYSNGQLNKKFMCKELDIDILIMVSEK